MCGIIYVRRKNFSPVRPLIKRYHEQSGRGTEGFGFVAVKDGVVVGYERAQTFGEIEKEMEKYKDANEILFHHRYPTSTENTPEQAHPIFVSNPKLNSDYYVVHNGVLRNYQAKKEEHNKDGFVYNTEASVKKVLTFNSGSVFEVEETSSYNDSEVLAIEFARWNEGLISRMDVNGSIALIAYEVDKETKKVKALHFGRNSGNPLVVWADSVRKDFMKEDYENVSKMLSAEMFIISSESQSAGSLHLNTGKILTYIVDEQRVISRDCLVETFYNNYATGYSKSIYNYNDYNNYNNNRSIGFRTNTDYRYDEDYDWDTGEKPDEKTSYENKSVTIESLFPYETKSTSPILDKKAYELMTKEELEWERLAIEDEQFQNIQRYNLLIDLEEIAYRDGVAHLDGKAYDKVGISELIEEYEFRSDLLYEHLEHVDLLLESKFPDYKYS
jgi:predicted glutamine amidotransferase